MFSLNQSRYLVALTVLVLATLGCSSPEETTAKKATPATPISGSQDASTATKEKSSQEKAAKEKSKIDQVASSYEAPYPNRNNPFQPPMNAPRVRTGNERDQNSSVTLVGFANVGEPKVVLAIDGVVSPMSNGEEIAGVQVISIAPPNAVLQRGRNRWTASLTN